MNDHEPQPFNEGHILEGMDRGNTILVMINELLDQHPAVVKVDGDHEIDVAYTAIFNLIQRIGELEDEQ